MSTMMTNMYTRKAHGALRTVHNAKAVLARLQYLVVILSIIPRRSSRHMMTMASTTWRPILLSSICSSSSSSSFPMASTSSSPMASLMLSASDAIDSTRWYDTRFPVRSLEDRLFLSAMAGRCYCAKISRARTFTR